MSPPPPLRVEFSNLIVSTSRTCGLHFTLANPESFLRSSTHWSAHHPPSIEYCVAVEWGMWRGGTLAPKLRGSHRYHNIDLMSQHIRSVMAQKSQNSFASGILHKAIHDFSESTMITLPYIGYRHISSGEWSVCSGHAMTSL